MWFQAFYFFSLWRNRVILLLSGVSLSNGGWYWTRCVAQLSTASPRRNKLKRVGKRMGKNQQVPVFISLLNMSSHVSWGEFLSTSKGCEGEERIAIQKSEIRIHNQHRTSCETFTSVLTAHLASQPCLQARREKLPSLARHWRGKTGCENAHQVLKIQAKYNRLLH